MVRLALGVQPDGVTVHACGHECLQGASGSSISVADDETCTTLGLEFGS